MCVFSTTCNPEESGFGGAKMIALPTARYCVLWDSLAQKMLSWARVYYNAIEEIAEICNAPGTEVHQLTLSSSVTSAAGSCWHLPPGIHTHPCFPPWDCSWLMLCCIMFVGTFYPIKALPEARCSVLVGTSFFKSKHFWADVIFTQFSLWNSQRQIFAWQCHSRVWGRNCCPSASSSVYICTYTQETHSGSTIDTANLNIHVLGNWFIKSHIQAHSNFELCNHTSFFTMSAVLWKLLLDLSGMETGFCVVESSSL